MKVIWRIVDLQRIFFAVKSELAFSNPICNPPDGGTEPWVFPQIALEIVESQNHVTHFPRTIRHPKLGQRRAISDHFGDCAMIIRKGEHFNAGAVWQSSERTRFH